ncbi:MAG: molybdopterin-guanine dinucleotide biosynthesis protein B [Candidatus Puniceispirillaceae bacterium]|jgi:molybdopterin-guanine dinucleotide biosynthesis protein B
MSETADITKQLDAARARHGLVIGLAGWSGSGKTTLAEQLIAGLTARGLEVATIKHAHHGFDADKPGKDSYRHRAAGARQVVVSSQARSVLFTENRDRGERRLEELLNALSPADIVIVEGYKREPIPKIEIFRLATGKPPLFTADPQIIAVATDEDDALPATPPHLLDLNDVDAIITFICAQASTGTIAAAS